MKKIPMEEIAVEFVYSRQQEMKISFGRCTTVLSSYRSGLNSKYIKLLSSSTSHTRHTACLSGTFVGSRIEDKFERINERGLRAVSSTID